MAEDAAIKQAAKEEQDRLYAIEREKAIIKHEEEQRLRNEEAKRKNDIRIAEEQRLQSLQDDVYPDLRLRITISFDGISLYGDDTAKTIIRNDKGDHDYECLRYNHDEISRCCESINKMLDRASVQTYVDFPLPKIFSEYVSPGEFSRDFPAIEIPLTDKNLCEIYLGRIPGLNFVSLFVSDPGSFSVSCAQIIKI
jgi:hypothetical protein